MVSLISDTQKIPKFIPHMRMQCHKKFYCMTSSQLIKILQSDWSVAMQ